MILISHNMPHVFEVADRIHIQRLGGCGGLITPQSHTMSEAVAIMTGATTLEETPGRPDRPESSRGGRGWCVITVVGEALVDLIEGPPGGPEAHPGGSPANVAVALARLGADVSLLTQVGADPHGRLVLEFLRANGVRLTPGSLLDATPTSAAHTTLRPDGQADYAFDIAWHAFGSTVDVTGDCVHTGSIGTFLEPGATGVTDLLRAAAATATVSYDPNSARH